MKNINGAERWGQHVHVEINGENYIQLEYNITQVTYHQNIKFHNFDSIMNIDMISVKGSLEAIFIKWSLMVGT